MANNEAPTLRCDCPTWFVATAEQSHHASCNQYNHEAVMSERDKYKAAAKEIVALIEEEREPYPEWSPQARKKYIAAAAAIISSHFPVVEAGELIGEMLTLLERIAETDRTHQPWLNDVIARAAALPAQPAAVQPAKCGNCGHAEIHNGPAGEISDACTHPECNCGYFQPATSDAEREARINIAAANVLSGIAVGDLDSRKLIISRVIAAIKTEW